MASFACHVLGGTKRLRLERIVRPLLPSNANRLPPLVATQPRSRNTTTSRLALPGDDTTRLGRWTLPTLCDKAESQICSRKRKKDRSEKDRGKQPCWRTPKGFHDLRANEHSSDRPHESEQKKGQGSAGCDRAVIAHKTSQ